MGGVRLPAAPSAALLPLAALLLAGCAAGTPTAPPSAAPSAVPTAAPSAGPTEPPAITPTPRPDLVLVVIGDSIPYNSEDDCPGCTGLAELYRDALAAATGRSVALVNNSEHTGLTVEQLLSGLETQQNRAEAVAMADAIIVGIAHNDVPMNRDDDACDGAGGEEPDWSRFTSECLQAELDRFRPAYEAVYARVAQLRAGKPTILRTINRYNDWIGWPDHPPAADGIAATARVIAAWNDMICTAAEAQGFTCVDISTAFNGPDGTDPSGDLLAADYTHPSQKGNDLIARILVATGFAPLVP